MFGGFYLFILLYFGCIKWDFERNIIYCGVIVGVRIVFRFSEVKYKVDMCFGNGLIEIFLCVELIIVLEIFVIIGFNNGFDG